MLALASHFTQTRAHLIALLTEINGEVQSIDVGADVAIEEVKVLYHGIKVL